MNGISNLTNSYAAFNAGFANNNDQNIIQNQIQQLQKDEDNINGNSKLNVDQKNKQIEQIEKKIEDLEKKLIQKQQEEEKKNEQKAAQANSNDSTVSDSQKQEDAEVALNKSIISGSTGAKQLKQLAYQRKTAIREDGPNSDKVRRIDGIIGEKMSQINKDIKISSQAVKDYIQKQKEDQQTNEDNVDNSDASTDIKTDDNNDKEQIEEKKAPHNIHQKAAKVYSKNDKTEVKTSVINEKA